MVFVMQGFGWAISLDDLQEFERNLKIDIYFFMYNNIYIDFVFTLLCNSIKTNMINWWSSFTMGDI